MSKKLAAITITALATLLVASIVIGVFISNHSRYDYVCGTKDKVTQRTPISTLPYKGVPEDTLFQYVQGNNGPKTYENYGSTTITILEDGSWTYLRFQPGFNYRVEDQGKLSEKQISKFTSLVEEETLKIKMDDSLIVLCKPSGPDENYVSYRFYSSKIEAKFDSCFYGGNRDQDLFKQTELVLEAIWEEISVPKIKENSMGQQLPL